MIDPGRLDRRIVLERRDGQLDAAGEDLPQWVAIATLPAQVEPVSGREGFSSQQRFAEATHTFTIRYRGGVDPTHRIRYEGRTYDILGVSEIGRREGLAIVAAARAETPTP